MNNDLTRVGKTIKSHGYKGEIKIHIEERFFPELTDEAVLFIGSRNPVPHFIEYIKTEKLPLIFKLEDVDTKETATEIANVPVYMKVEIQPEEVPSDLVYIYLEGYLIQDQKSDWTGRIKEIVQYPQQEMAVVLKEKKEILVPLNDTFIIEVREEDQIVLMDVPEGIFDL